MWDCRKRSSASKKDLLDGLIAEIKKRGQRLRCISIVGPIGTLWAYFVDVFLEEQPGKLLVNSVVYAHARITNKSTGELTEAQYDDMVTRLRTIGVLSATMPPPSKNVTDSGPQMAQEYGYNVLLARWKPGSDKLEMLYAKLIYVDTDGTILTPNLAKAYFVTMNTALKGLKRTYPLAKK